MRRRARLLCAILAAIGMIGEASLTFSTPERGWTNTLAFGGFGLLGVVALMTLLALNSSD